MDDGRDHSQDDTYQVIIDRLKKLDEVQSCSAFIQGKKDALKGKLPPENSSSRYKDGYAEGKAERHNCQFLIRLIRRQISKLREQRVELRKLIGKKR